MNMIENMRQCDEESFNTGDAVIAFKNSLYKRKNDDVISGLNYFGLRDDVISGLNYFGLRDDVISGLNYFGLRDDIISGLNYFGLRDDVISGLNYFGLYDDNTSLKYSQSETLRIKNYLISLGYVNEPVSCCRAYSNDLPSFIDMEIPC